MLFSFRSGPHASTDFSSRWSSVWILCIFQNHLGNVIWNQSIYISVYNAPQTMNAITLILHLVCFKVNDISCIILTQGQSHIKGNQVISGKKCIFNLYFSSI